MKNKLMDNESIINKIIKKKDNNTKWIIDIIGLALISCFITLFIFHYFLAFVIVPSGSMEPTIKSGDKLFAVRVHNYEPERGDIVVFDAPDEFQENKYFIKRVIGIPGDTITFSEGKVILNGEILYEPYIMPDTETKALRNDHLTFSVPDGCVFLMGDNREHSADARVWENPYTDINSIIGKYITTVF